MSMPDDLVLVRHGESEGNVVVEAAKNGDTSAYTDEWMTVPGHQWRLTDVGRAQAACAGAWLREQFITGPALFRGPALFSRHYVSPYARTKETAAHLDIHRYTGPEGDATRERLDAPWTLNRALRERDWGDIGSIPRAEFLDRPDMDLNARQWRIDPLYWVPPGGESIAHVAENRVRNVLDTLHREVPGGRVLAVTHGETMWAFRLVLERLDDDDFLDLDARREEKIRNCEVLHYTRIDPATGKQAPRMQWLRRARPVADHAGAWSMHVGPWRHFDKTTLSGAELLASIRRPLPQPGAKPGEMPAHPATRTADA